MQSPSVLQCMGQPGDAVGQRNSMQSFVVDEQLPLLAQMAADVNCDGPLQVSPAPQLAPVVTVQVPTLPGTLQAWQPVLQLVLQQTPSTQLPRLHWSLALHEAPSPCLETQLLGVFPLQ